MMENTHAGLCFGTNIVQHDVFAMLTDADQDCDGFSINNSFDGKLFNLRKLHAKSK